MHDPPSGYGPGSWRRMVDTTLLGPSAVCVLLHTGRNLGYGY